MSNDLVTWLRDQLQAEREQALEVGVDGGSALDDEHRYGGLIITGRRLLDQTDAMLRILDRHASYDFPHDLEDGPGAYSWTGRCDHCHEPWPCPDLRDVAAPYADWPGYRDEWRPE